MSTNVETEFRDAYRNQGLFLPAPQIKPCKQQVAEMLTRGFEYVDTRRQPLTGRVVSCWRLGEDPNARYAFVEHAKEVAP